MYKLRLSARFGLTRAPGARRLSSLCSLYLVLAMTAGCGGGGERALDRYASRLARVLGEPVVVAAPAPLALPRPRALRHDLSGESLDLLDMLTLGDCALEITIGRRNSSLGKVAPASQRLLQELAFLREAPACIALLETTGELALADRLRATAARKRAQLYHRIWNATLGGPEFRAFWSRSASAGDYPGFAGEAVPLALERLSTIVARWQRGDLSADGQQLESLLGVLRRGDGGALLRARDLQVRSLQAATSAVRTRFDTLPMCFQGHASAAGRVLDNVVRKFFVGEVQPWLVSATQREARLLPPVRVLEAQLAAVQPAAYTRWMIARERMLTEAAEAPRAHVAALLPLLESCGLAPG